MTYRVLTRYALILAISAFTFACTAPEEPSEGPTPPHRSAINAHALTARAKLWEDLLALHPIILPRHGEATWAEVPWLTDLWQARQKAAAEGKPIFVWSASGEPLGCT